MKGFCYIVLIIGFFVFYQQNPVYAIIIIVLFIGVYLFFKSRSSSGRGVFGFLSGKQPQQESKIDDLITLMMIQQLMNSSSQNSDNQTRDEKKKEHEQHIDKIKKEVLDLLEDD
ncbi:MAG: hypothetical protein ACFE9X_13650 [Promethearchaeota archaeon]